jgi:hypothetical protein
MEEMKTVTIEEVKKAIGLLQTFAEQHKNAALFVALVADQHINMCLRGTQIELENTLALYATLSNPVREIITAVGDSLQDDSEEGEKYRAALKSILDNCEEQ